MTAAQESKTPARYWILCILLFLATTLNYLDRQTMSILAPVIQKEMALDNEALGWLGNVRAADKDKPWFVYYSAAAAHAPHHAPPAWREKFKSYRRRSPTIGHQS